MLHHYTTVSTLALILRHQTLRFTRLDQFDDVSEGRSIGHFPLGARTFASCWSAAREESIPQWAMYGDGMKGIRLSLRPDPFIWHPIDSIDTYGPPRAQPCELQVREASKTVSLLLQNHVQSGSSII